MSSDIKRIAIIGAGVSGLYTAYLLNKQYDVTVFEKNKDIGGHTATKTVSVPSGDYCIDTGFIVYNDRTYPNFIKLLDELGVEGQNTNMGFSVSCDHIGYEYAGTSLGGLFAQRKNWLSIKHWKLLLDITKFNRLCTKLYQARKISQDATLGSFLLEHKFSIEFERYYILPMVSAIWSSGTEMASQMPLQFFIRFFYNHGLLTIFNQPQWKTVTGGSHSYLQPLTEMFADRIVTEANIQCVTREDRGAVLHFSGGTTERFDGIVFACHSDEALSLLSSPSTVEREILGSIPYKGNQVVLHTDASILPSAKSAWASWNYRLDGTGDSQTLLTYNMNILQNIDSPETFCVSVNPNNRIDEKLILGQYTYHHPVFTQESVLAQERWQEISGADRIYYCGAYWRNGFHEDGVVSALNVANQFGVSP
ncbi:FAD-dependent oxidoreductase [Gilvimarinus sp. SDUM040013]|uniref:FAD-dependent oxidoreductase n=1 Tax=Gilvimarinus gilvus TaxID=3058038 RepID=A0ABU4S2D2_9GAMM|nr:FAD-dependent oxidoreductase [Gilvimarinus sp. SDUM040013]MDO3385569.1 FAD-dependent oxidoreductase [Gilvimarinus sp. SDUM040013]MDX6851180.1 FAD-dependent oxidoreductase [Gilvimarinus sp. SDUM040013]